MGKAAGLPFAALYGLGIAVRNLMYQLRIFNSFSFDFPLIGVGNLTVGGTGKTPHSEYIAELLLKNYTVGYLSRGYRRQSRGLVLAGADADAATIGDEAMQVKRKFPDLKVAVSAQRLQAIPEMLMEWPGLDCIILDDAFQHRTVRPGLQILLMDYHQPWHRDLLLPAGRLREFPAARQRADILVITRCPENPDPEDMRTLRKKIKWPEDRPLFFTQMVYDAPYRWNQPGQPTDIAGPVILLSGIAGGESFEKDMRARFEVIRHFRFPDHHRFTAEELRHIDSWREAHAPEAAILTTEKDLTRLLLHRKLLTEWNWPLYVQPLRVEFLRDKSEFDRLINSFVADSNNPE